MANTTLGFSTTVGSRSVIGALQLDAMVSESTELRSRATQFPVEDGSTISDNVSVEPEKLTISGVVSSMAATVYGPAGWSKLIAAKDVLRQIHEARDPITVTTGLDTYDDMVMESCRIGRTNEGIHLQVECELVKIKRVELKTTSVPETRANGKTKGKAGATKTSAGKANGTTPSASTQAQATAKVDAALKKGKP